MLVDHGNEATDRFGSVCTRNPFGRSTGIGNLRSSQPSSVPRLKREHRYSGVTCTYTTSRERGS